MEGLTALRASHTSPAQCASTEDAVAVDAVEEADQLALQDEFEAHQAMAQQGAASRQGQGWLEAAQGAYREAHSAFDALQQQEVRELAKPELRASGELHADAAAARERGVQASRRGLADAYVQQRQASRAAEPELRADGLTEAAAAAAQVGTVQAMQRWRTEAHTGAVPTLARSWRAGAAAEAGAGEAIYPAGRASGQAAAFGQPGPAVAQRDAAARQGQSVLQAALAAFRERQPVEGPLVRQEREEAARVLERELDEDALVVGAMRAAEAGAYELAHGQLGGPRSSQPLMPSSPLAANPDPELGSADGHALQPPGMWWRQAGEQHVAQAGPHSAQPTMPNSPLAANSEAGPADGEALGPLGMSWRQAFEQRNAQAGPQSAQPTLLNSPLAANPNPELDAWDTQVLGQAPAPGPPAGTSRFQASDQRMCEGRLVQDQVPALRGTRLGARANDSGEDSDSGELSRRARLPISRSTRLGARENDAAGDSGAAEPDWWAPAPTLCGTRTVTLARSVREAAARRLSTRPQQHAEGLPPPPPAASDPNPSDPAAAQPVQGREAAMGSSAQPQELTEACGVAMRRPEEHPMAASRRPGARLQQLNPAAASRSTSACARPAAPGPAAATSGSASASGPAAASGAVPQQAEAGPGHGSHASPGFLRFAGASSREMVSEGAAAASNPAAAASGPAAASGSAAASGFAAASGSAADPGQSAAPSPSAQQPMQGPGQVRRARTSPSRPPRRTTLRELTAVAVEDAAAQVPASGRALKLPEAVAARPVGLCHLPVRVARGQHMPRSARTPPQPARRPPAVECSGDAAVQPAGGRSLLPARALPGQHALPRSACTLPRSARRRSAGRAHCAEALPQTGELQGRDAQELVISEARPSAGAAAAGSAAGAAPASAAGSRVAVAPPPLLRMARGAWRGRGSAGEAASDVIDLTLVRIRAPLRHYRLALTKLLVPLKLAVCRELG